MEVTKLSVIVHNHKPCGFFIQLPKKQYPPPKPGNIHNRPAHPDIHLPSNCNSFLYCKYLATAALKQ